VNVGPLVPTGLRCAHKAGPLSVEADRVRFSWHFVADGVGRRQTAYQVQVARDVADFEGAGDCPWDSGRTQGDSSSGIEYAGTPLDPDHRYFWRARVWDEAERSGPWSNIASFTTALSASSGWDGCS
jgi:alpha-L-rhamnosidase